MASRNTLQWNPIQAAGVGSPTESMANAMRGFSQAGTIFGDIRKDILDREQKDLENQFREKQFNESVRQFGLNYGLDIDKLKEDIRKTNIQAETTRRGQDLGLEGTKYSADSSAATARARLDFDKEKDKRIADAETRALAVERDANKILQDLAISTEEEQKQNLINLQQIDAKIASPEFQLAASDPTNPAVLNILKSRDELNKKANTPVSERDIQTRFAQEMMKLGHGKYALPIIEKEAASSGDHARALQLRRVDSLNEKVKGSQLSSKEYFTFKNKAVTDIAKLGQAEANKANEIATFMEQNGYDQQHIISILNGISHDTSILERNLPSFNIGNYRVNQTDAYAQLNDTLEWLKSEKNKKDKKEFTPPPKKESTKDKEDTTADNRLAAITRKGSVEDSTKLFDKRRAEEEAKEAEYFKQLPNEIETKTKRLRELDNKKDKTLEEIDEKALLRSELIYLNVLRQQNKR